MFDSVNKRQVLQDKFNNAKIHKYNLNKKSL